MHSPKQRSTRPLYVCKDSMTCMEFISDATFCLSASDKFCNPGIPSISKTRAIPKRGDFIDRSGLVVLSLSIVLFLCDTDRTVRGPRPVERETAYRRLRSPFWEEEEATTDSNRRFQTSWMTSRSRVCVPWKLPEQSKQQRIS